jgi:hypothetical protein
MQIIFKHFILCQKISCLFVVISITNHIKFNCTLLVLDQNYFIFGQGFVDMKNQTQKPTL